MPSNILKKLDTNPEVAIEIPAMILVASLLRHWGYLVYSSGDEWGTRRDDRFTTELRDYRFVVVGTAEETRYSYTKIVKTGFFKWESKTFEESNVQYSNIGAIYLDEDSDQLIILCNQDLEHLPLLTEIANKLQLELNKPVKLRVVRVNNISLTPDNQSLNLLIDDTQKQTAALLISKVAKRLEVSTQQRVNPDLSVELWSNGGESPTKLLLASSISNDKETRILCTLYQADLEQKVQEEIAGLRESLQYRGISLYCDIQRN